MHRCFYDNDYIFKDNALTQLEYTMSVIYATYYGYCHTCHRKYTWTEAFIKNKGDEGLEEVDEKPLDIE